MLFVLSIAATLAMWSVIAAAQNPPVFTYPATAAGVRAFLEEVNRELLRLGISAGRAFWIQSTYITQDTETMAAEAGEAVIAANTRYAKEASRWDGVQLPPLDRRQLDVLKKTLTVSSPSDSKEAEELARLMAAMEGAYGRAKYCPGGSSEDCLDVEKITQIMAEDRDPQRLRDVWEGWHKQAVPMRKDYARFVELSNKGAQVLGFVVAASDQMGGGSVTGAIGNRQQGTGAVDFCGGGTLRTAQAGELFTLLRRERSQGIFAVARHGTPRDTRITTRLFQIRRQTTH